MVDQTQTAAPAAGEHTGAAAAAAGEKRASRAGSWLALLTACAAFAGATFYQYDRVNHVPFAGDTVAAAEEMAVKQAWTTTKPTVEPLDTPAALRLLKDLGVDAETIARAENAKFGVLRLRDWSEEDGDVVEIDAGALHATVPLRKAVTSIPVPAGAHIRVTAKDEGLGGGTTVEINGVKVPTLRVGESIEFGGSP